MLTSIGFHTFTIFLRLTYDEALELYRAFQKYGHVRIRPLYNDGENPTVFPKIYVVEYISGCKGITWYIRFDDKTSQYTKPSQDHLNPNYHKEPAPYSVRATINPKILIGITDYLTAANYDCLNEAEACFNEEAAKISPLLSRFECYSMNRGDYCLNADVVELKVGCSAEQMIALIKRSDIPEGFSEWKKYNETSNRMKAKKIAHYLQNRSVTINYYWKYGQLLDEFPDCPNLEASRDLIRLEVQCKYPKVYAMSKNSRHNSRLYKGMTDNEIWEEFMSGQVITNPIDVLLTDSVAFEIVSKYFYKVIGKGDYYSLEDARKKIRCLNCHLKVKNRLIDTLELVNRCRSVSKAKATLQGKELDDFKRSLKDLGRIGVNPVTIPKEWKIKYIRNLLNAYYDKLADEQVREKYGI